MQSPVKAAVKLELDELKINYTEVKRKLELTQNATSSLKIRSRKAAATAKANVRASSSRR